MGVEGRRLAALVLTLLGWSAQALGQPARGEPVETVAAVQVQGNVLTPQEEVLRIAGVRPGVPFDDEMPTAVGARLRADGRFVRVDVLKRFASITDPSRIALVIIVDEGPVSIRRTGDPDAPARLVRSRLRLLFAPILKFDEGYGVSYGLRVARPDVMGPRSRISVPLSWGAERRAALELERGFERGAVRRIEGGARVTRRRHPHYRVPDLRTGITVLGDTSTVRSLRATASGGVEAVTFGDRPDRLVRAGAGLTFDNRVDPLLARHAVFARASVERLWSRNSGSVVASTVEVRGHLGLYGPSILVVRVAHLGASGPLPMYEKRMLGGTEVLRGFRRGHAVGDTLSAGSVELRTPVTSPLRLARLGVSVFLDAAAVYDVGSRLRDQRFDRGVGAGGWLSAGFVRLNASVARGLRRGTRVNVGASLMF